MTESKKEFELPWFELAILESMGTARKMQLAITDNMIDSVIIRNGIAILGDKKTDVCVTMHYNKERSEIEFHIVDAGVYDDGIDEFMDKAKDRGIAHIPKIVEEDELMSALVFVETDDGGMMLCPVESSSGLGFMMLDADEIDTFHNFLLGCRLAAARCVKRMSDLGLLNEQTAG